MRSLVAHTPKYCLAGVILIMATSLFAGSGLYSFTLNSIDGKPAPLADYKGKVVLIVNVASQCGLPGELSHAGQPTKRFDRNRCAHGKADRNACHCQ